MIPTVVVTIPQPIGTVTCLAVIAVAFAHLGLSVYETRVWLTEIEAAPVDEPDTDEMPTVIAHPSSSEARKAELLRPVPYRRDDDPWRQQFRFSENGRRHG